MYILGITYSKRHHIPFLHLCLTLIDGGLSQVTSSSSLDHVADAKALHSLVLNTVRIRYALMKSYLRHTAVAVQAANIDDVSASLLSASVIAAFDSLEYS